MNEHSTMTVTDPDHAALADFPQVSRDTIRYGDTDRQGHVNNSVFSSYFETGRVTTLDAARAQTADSNREFVLASITIDYLRELHWPGEATVGTRISKVGRTSATMEQLLVSAGEVRARATSTIVQIDTLTRTPTPFTEAQRRGFAETLA